MKRRDFLQYLSTATLLSSLPGCNLGVVPKKISGSIVGANHQFGHLIRQAVSIPVHETIDKEVIIIGGGVSGLTAARELHRVGINNFALLEMHHTVGGNAVGGENKVSAFPWGAHYLPIPNLNQSELIQFLEEVGVISHWENNVPYFNDDYLCYEPEERLFIRNHWQEGLIPDFGLADKDRQEIGRFLDLMHQFKEKTGTDGKPQFTIPIAHCSQDETFEALNGQSFAEYVNQNNFQSPYLLWYLNYCCRDDYGTTLSETSAWAGIHYFASRKGKAVNASDIDVLTWPEGNYWLIKQLSKTVVNHIISDQLVFKVKPHQDGVSVFSVNASTHTVTEYRSKKVILCTPQFINSCILEGFPYFSLNHVLDYAPWMVANITLKSFPQKNGQELSWDNVIYQGYSLGYVNANHQTIKTVQDKLVFTFYQPLTEQDPKTERTFALEKSHDDWVKHIINELEIPHPGIAEYIENIDIWLWGHAMVRPKCGVINHPELRQLTKYPDDRLYFAHSDMSGISIFEEAFYHGTRAAKQLIASL